jgi:two-component system, LuxR family, response regulator FixJ
MSEPAVYIVDDDAALRDATRLFLTVHGLPTRSFASAEAFLEAWRPDCAGCLLLDLKMPGMGGQALLLRLLQGGNAPPIVVVTAHGDVATARHALKNGAFDFLEKPVANDILLEVVTHALAHDRARRTDALTAGQRRERIERLTSRERQVMQHLAQGHSHREIAAALGISPRTVEVYKTRMMEKLQARTLADVIRLAVGADAGP